LNDSSLTLGLIELLSVVTGNTVTGNIKVPLFTTLTFRQQKMEYENNWEIESTPYNNIFKYIINYYYLLFKYSINYCYIFVKGAFKGTLMLPVTVLPCYFFVFS